MSPEYFYRCLERNLNLRNMFEMFKFGMELGKTFRMLNDIYYMTIFEVNMSSLKDEGVIDEVLSLYPEKNIHKD